MDLETFEDFENHALILMDYYSAIFSNRAIGMAFKRHERHIFSYLNIQYVGIKYFLVDFLVDEPIF